MKRRQFLRSVPAVGALSLAGCSSVGGPRGTVLGTIEVVNFSVVPHRIYLYVVRDHEIIVDRDISLAAMGDDGERAGRIVDPGLTKRARYSVREHHLDEGGDRSSSKWEYRFTHRDYEAYYGDSHEDPGCVGAVVKVGSLSDDRIPSIGIGPTYVDEPCGTQ